MVRHKVLPAIADLAQVHGLRNGVQLQARVRYDLAHLRRSMAKTARCVLTDNKAF
jgi:hypothetical protein